MMNSIYMIILGIILLGLIVGLLLKIWIKGNRRGLGLSGYIFTI